jgi:hypothetical protein
MMIARFGVGISTDQNPSYVGEKAPLPSELKAGQVLSIEDADEAREERGACICVSEEYRPTFRSLYLEGSPNCPSFWNKESSISPSRCGIRPASSRR